jgi:hypothetical protein
MALCSQSDIEALRQIDFTNDPDGTVAQIIRLAEGILEGVTGRSFTPVVDEVVLADGLRQTDGLIWLETFPVTAVAVSAADGSSYTVNTHFTWDRSGRIRRLGHGGQAWTWTWQYEPWTGPAWPKGTTITFSGGASDPDDVPGDLRMLCAEVAADLFDKGAAAGPAGVVQESLGGWAATYQRLAGNLTDQQLKIARRYMRDRGQLVLT